VPEAQGQVRETFGRRRRPPRNQPGRGVQGPVAQGLGFRTGEVAVEDNEPQPGQQGRGDQGGGQPRGIDPEVEGRNRPMPQSFPVRIRSSTLACGVDIAQLGAPAPQAGRHVRCPEGVMPAVPGLGLGLEKGQLGARVRPLAAAEDPHARGPARPAGPRPGLRAAACGVPEVCVLCELWRWPGSAVRAS
jgi:hypothetical protein